MSSSRKRRFHRCVRHPRAIARGRCSRCGNWVCTDCAVLYKGQFYCAETCAPGQAATVQMPAQKDTTTIEIAPRPSAQASWSRIIAGSALTLALCVLVFALWAVREIVIVRRENRLLNERRLELIALVKKYNAQIAALEQPSHPATPLPVTLTPRIESKQLPYRSEPPPPPDLTPEGIPLSFDNGSTGLPLVALTFDGGSHANAAYQILDTLASRSVKATMFVTGEFIRRFPEVVRRVHSEGHELGNHTMSHPHLTSWETDRSHHTLPDITERAVVDQLRRNQAFLEQSLGLSFAPVWRAPYGEKNRAICQWGLNAGYLHIGWRQGRSWRYSLDSNDWIPNEETPGYKSPREVLEKISGIAEAKPYGANGGIILMHLGTERARPEQQVHLVLGELIDSLRRSGYTLVTAGEMARQSGVDLQVVAALGGPPQVRAE